MVTIPTNPYGILIIDTKRADDVVENKATAIPLALDGGLRQPKVENYYILMTWKHGNQKTDTNTYWKGGGSKC